MALDRKAQQELAAFAKKQKIKNKKEQEELDEQRQANLEADALLAFRDYERAKQRERRGDDFLLTPMRENRRAKQFVSVEEVPRDWDKPAFFKYFKYLKFWKPFTWLWNFKI